MPTLLNILIVEDSQDDADLMIRELQHAGFAPSWKRVETESAFLEELSRCPDLVLSDYSMPRFNGLRAVELMRASGRNIPFILISGTVGEDVAVEAMRHGATDYLLKDRIARLGPAVSHALEQKLFHEKQEQTNRELLWKTAFLEALVNSAPDGVLVVDTQKRKILQNDRFIELFKVPAEIAREENDAELLVHVTARVRNSEQFHQRVIWLYSHPDEISRDEIELVDGTILDRYSAPVHDKAGNYYGRIWTFRDVTERRRLEDQFRQAQKMEAMGQLAGGVAHDFNNILAVIQMQADLLKGCGNTGPEQKELADEIVAAAQRAAALTRQLLLFSRKEKPRLQDLDLNHSINNLTKMLRRTIGENIQMQFRFAMEPLFIRADAGMIDQVLINLAVNARDAMSNGGKLVIETSTAEFDEAAAAQSAKIHPGAFVCLSVSDNGTGMAPEILRKIFEPFFTTKGAGKGTGLGLATVLGIVQQHQGWIDVCSEPGHGSTFRIYLPRLQKSSDETTKESEMAQLPRGTETILLVEDDSALCVSVRKSLMRLGYQVFAAATGIEALKIWRQNRDKIHLLLTDLIMPGGMTGKDLAEQLVKEKPELKVIYTSGYGAEIAGTGFSLEEGVNFLTKPFQAAELARIVRAQFAAR